VSNPNIQIHEATDATFHAGDVTDARFYIDGTCVGGYLRFEVVAELPTGERGAVRGREFFDAMMSHFGESIECIEGDWSDATRGFVANLDEFNTQTAAGVSQENAARRTWTGRMAKRHGYDSITIEHALPKGAAGHYREVFVRFRRP